MPTTILSPRLFDAEAFPTAMLAPWLQQAVADRSAFSDEDLHPAVAGIMPILLGCLMCVFAVLGLDIRG